MNKKETEQGERTQEAERATNDTTGITAVSNASKMAQVTDTERLDWLQNHSLGFLKSAFLGSNLRECIDAAATKGAHEASTKKLIDWNKPVAETEQNNRDYIAANLHLINPATDFDAKGNLIRRQPAAAPAANDDFASWHNGFNAAIEAHAGNTSRREAELQQCCERLRSLCKDVKGYLEAIKSVSNGIGEEDAIRSKIQALSNAIVSEQEQG
jgi:hypothetical protein